MFDEKFLPQTQKKKTGKPNQKIDHVGKAESFSNVFPCFFC